MEPKSHEKAAQLPSGGETKAQHNGAVCTGGGPQYQELDIIDNPYLYNRILSGVFLIYASFMGFMCWAIWTIMANSTDDDRMDMNVRYHVYGLGYFIATAYFAAASRKYHHRFPHNLLILSGAFSGLTVLFALQVTRFDAEHLHFSDIPAIRFGFASFVLLWLFSLAFQFPSTTLVGRVTRLLIVALTAAVSTVAYRLDKDYRIVSLILVGLGVVYCVIRAESLASRAQRELVDNRRKREDRFSTTNSNIWIHSIRISLQIIVWVLIVFSGVFTFSYYVMRPNLPWPGA